MTIRDEHGRRPRRKFRVLIQERKSRGSSIERMTSFMIYSYDKRVSLESIKEKLMKRMRLTDIK